jgi:hypothetical protein
MAQERPDYLSYLLRLWREGGNGQSQNEAAEAAWRMSIETPAGESHGFTSLDDLLGFLRQQIGARPDVEMGASPSECQIEEVDQS